MATATRDLSADAQAILAAAGPQPRMAATVAELLASSRSAHEQFLRLSNHWTPTIGQPNPQANPVLARQQLERAATLRAYAQVLDPQHTDPAWAAETGTVFEHANLLPYYRGILLERRPYGGFKVSA